MPDEDLVDFVVRNLLGCQPFVTAGSNVEQELVTVPQLDQPAGGALLGPGARHAGPQGDHPHLVRRERFGAGIVDVQLIDHRHGPLS